MTGKKVLTWLIFFFLGIGILRTLIVKPSTILIPLLVFGTIYYFLKNPDTLRKLTNKFNGRNNNYYRNKNKSSNYKFEVIDGKKNKDDDRPKYH